MNRNTKIILAIILVVILTSILLFFLARRNAPVITNKNASQTTQNTLPVSQNSTQKATNTIPYGSTEAASPSGKETASSEILSQYGKYAFETLQKFPSLVKQITDLDSDFNPSQMYISYPSRTYSLSNGKDYLAFGGCTEHNCGGTKIIALYCVTDNSIYLGKENDAQTQLQFFGDPTDEEKNTMTNFYLQK